MLGVEPNGPAEKAGIQHGDFIISLDGKKMSTPRELQGMVRDMKPGNKVKLTVWSEGETKQVDVTLGARRSASGSETANASQRNQTQRPGQEDQTQRLGQQNQNQGAARPSLSGSETANAGRQQNQAWLGVGLGQHSNTPGALIVDVFPKGPAAQAGLKEGDVIVRLNEQKIQSPEQLVKRLDDMKPNKKVQLTVQRDGKDQQIAATLGNRSDFNLVQNTRQQRFGFRGVDSQDSQDENFQASSTQGDDLLLQQHRHLAEQHERIESMVQDLTKQVQALREELQRVRQHATPRTGGTQPRSSNVPRP